MGCHPLILGYADKDINNSVIKQLKGVNFQSDERTGG